jgi:hypothetical protein
MKAAFLIIFSMLLGALVFQTNAAPDPKGKLIL